MREQGWGWGSLHKITRKRQNGAGNGSDDLVFVETVIGAGFEEDGSGNVQEVTGYQARQDHEQIGALQFVLNDVIAEKNTQWRGYGEQE